QSVGVGKGSRFAATLFCWRPQQGFLTPHRQDGRMRRRLQVRSLAALLIGCASSAAMAGSLSLSGGATAGSAYPVRGISQSGRDPALQAELKLSHTSGLYVGAWASTIDLYDDDPALGFNSGSDLEVDGLAGWSGDVVPGLSADIGMTWYLYPGVTGS